MRMRNWIVWRRRWMALSWTERCEVGNTKNDYDESLDHTYKL